MPLISVIIPIHNAEKYISKCLDSLLCQTHQDLQILAIDDGSTDNTSKIIDEYIQKDSRVTVLHQKNAGVAAARNAGLKLAKGDYIFFCDNDDFLSPNAFEKLLQTAEEHNADYVGFSIDEQTPSGEKKGQRGGSDGRVEHLSIEQYFDLYLEGCVYFTPWSHFCKRAVCENIFYPEREKIAACDDAVVALPTLQNSKKIVFLHEPLYHYTVEREDSGVRKVNMRVLAAWMNNYFLWYSFSNTLGKKYHKKIKLKYIDQIGKCFLVVRNKFPSTKKIPISNETLAKVAALIPFGIVHFVSKRFL